MFDYEKSFFFDNDGNIKTKYYFFLNTVKNRIRLIKKYKMLK